VIYHSFRNKSEDDRFGGMPKRNDENPLEFSRTVEGYGTQTDRKKLCPQRESSVVRREYEFQDGWETDHGPTEEEFVC
jgi:hypothetical protein